MSDFIKHYFAPRGGDFPAVDEGLLLDYLVGSNCTLARSRRPGLEAGVPVSAHAVRGLAEVWPYVVWDYPRVPARFLDTMLGVSRARCQGGRMIESLFYLHWSLARPAQPDPRAQILLSDEGWHLEFPDQSADEESVAPLYTGAGSATDRAVVEVHSHHAGAADFSGDDDADELGWFRVCAILGTIFDRPAVRARVTVFGHAWEFPASLFFELPAGLTDCVESEIRELQGASQS